MSAHLLIQGDARRLPLKAGSVHAVICSPPYFNLRSYLDADDPRKSREIGAEPTPAGFVEAMRAVGREVWRVLRGDGSWWLNLGDSYNAYNGNRGASTSFQASTERALPKLPGGFGLTVPDLKPGDLCLIPERVALALQADGWYVRAKPPWMKPNPMPESTRSRPNTAHESLYLLTKNSRYYFDMDAVKRPMAALSEGRYAYAFGGEKNCTLVAADRDGIGVRTRPIGDREPDPAGRHLRTNDFADDSLDDLIAHHEGYAAHLRSVRDNGGMLSSEAGDPLGLWVSLSPFHGSHYATFPPRLIEPLIKASTSEAGCCPACGKCWERVTERTQVKRRRPNDYVKRTGAEGTGNSCENSVAGTSVVTLGWRPACDCPPADPEPCIVLDPFAGSGTTLMVARQLGRRAIGVDLDADNGPMAAARIAEGLRPLSRLDAPPPPKPLPGQLELFGDGDGDGATADSNSAAPSCAIGGGA